MLTRGRIEREVSAWKRNGEPEGIVGKAHYLELCRLALLGLEREESRARVAAGIEAERHVESSVLADAFGAFPDLEPVPKRDARAEMVGRAVIRAFGQSPSLYRDWAAFVRDLRDRGTAVSLAPMIYLLLSIANAMEEP